jgi:cysteine desulfurase/selenocysteine lyase
MKQGKTTPVFPTHIKPMLATLTDEPFDDPDWTYEVKWDGYRALAFINGKEVELQSRNSKSFNEKFYPIRDTLANWNTHMKVDVQELDVDFLAFSGHKVYGPTGIGVLYGKTKWLDDLPPYQGGGDMIKTVTFAKTTYNEPPFKFEAGTPDISGAVGLAAALDYINEIGLENIAQHEHELIKYAEEKLAAIEGFRFIGNSPNRAGAISFMIEGLHPFDVGELLDKQGIAVRTGHHCTEPVMDFFGIPGTIRASFAFYNTFEEIDTLVAALKKAITILK